MKWADLSAEEKRIILAKVATTTGISEAAVEKDIYVCWCLQQLFTLNNTAPSMIFKGGTSLSKVYGSIQRFSEDIDITIDQHHFLKETDPLDPTLSKKKVRTLLEQLDAAVDSFAHSVLIPWLKDRVGQQSDGWCIEKGAFQTVMVTYPSVVDSLPYLSRRVAIELGARNVLEPREIHRVSSYAAAHFPMIAFPEGQSVAVLSPVRTFWEKATILHAEYHRPEPRAADRIARHWYDMAMLATHPIRDRALADIDMLANVADYKDRIYPSGWASYSTARAATLHLVPHAILSALLQNDYESMVRAGFFFSTPPTWAEILARLADLEAAIRSGNTTTALPEHAILLIISIV
jgi:Nucleotidyl transferase AbiEii toxin, Type IV TA system